MTYKRRRVYADNKGIQGKITGFLYKTVPGRVVLKMLVRPCVSEAAGKFMDSQFSTFLIKPFIKYNHINMDEYEKCRYKSFNSFFTRKIKKSARSFSIKSGDLCAPCDAKLGVYKITGNSVFKIKDSYYNIWSLTGSRKIARYYNGGILCVFRLSVDDYHRYAYIDAGKQKGNYRIPGVLHTVNPAALEEFPVYKENTREFSVLYSENFGRVLMLEIGAMLVGRIINYNRETYAMRGQEKGRFEYGGSTVILAFEKGRVAIDKEIVLNSRHGYETVVKMGEVIGKKQVL